MSTTVQVRINEYKFTYFYGNVFGDDGVIVAQNQDKAINTDEFIEALKSAMNEFNVFSQAMYYSEVYQSGQIIEPHEYDELLNGTLDSIDKINSIIWLKENHLHDDVYSNLMNHLNGTLNCIRSLIDKEAKRAAKKSKRKPKPGHIYLIQAVTPDNYYKIGLSKDPATRIESMGVKLPFPVDTLHTFETDDMTQTEKILHDRFSDKRINGEWFELEAGDVEYFKSISGWFGGQVFHD